MPRDRNGHHVPGRHNYAKMRVKMVERFPLCFAPKDVQKLPLAIGIRKDLVAACPDIPKPHLLIFLRRYCLGTNYQQALRAGGKRVRLDGTPDGEVTEEQARTAAAFLEQRWAKAAA